MQKYQFGKKNKCQIVHKYGKSYVKQKQSWYLKGISFFQNTNMARTKHVSHTLSKFPFPIEFYKFSIQRLPHFVFVQKAITIEIIATTPIIIVKPSI